MKYRHLLTGIVLIGLLVPLATAWAGAGQRAPFNPEESLAHVCQQERNKSCTVAFNPEPFGERKECGCSQGDQCVVDYVTPAIKGTLFLIADEDVTVPFTVPEDCATCDPTTQICDLCELKRLAKTALTILLSVKKGGQTRFFAETHVSSEDNGVTFDRFLFDPVSEHSLPREADPKEKNLLFVSPQSDMAQGLRGFFGGVFKKDLSLATPVIVKIEDVIESSNQEGDPPPAQPGLASVSQLRIKFRFARPTSSEPLPCP